MRKEGRRGTIKRDWKGREANTGIRVERDLIQGAVTNSSTSGGGTDPRTHTHAATKWKQTYNMGLFTRKKSIPVFYSVSSRP